VLFLFVIMLLGSEKVQDDATPEVRRSRRRFTLIASGLAAALLVLVGIPLSNVNLDLATETGELPQVRALHVAPDLGAVNVYANDQLIASDLEFDQNSSYVTLNPGDYAIRVEPVAGGDPLTTSVTLQRGTEQTLIAYDDGTLTVSADDNSTVTEDRSARLTFFNADSTPVQLLDLGSDLNANDNRVVIQQIDPGATSDALVVPEGAINWAFVNPAEPTDVLYRVEDFNLDRDTSGLIVLTRERVFDGTARGFLRPFAVPVIIEAHPSFGGPKAIGLALFSNYMLVFQLLAVLLLAAMIGAIVLTHRQTRSTTRKATGRRRVSRPLVSAIASQVGHEVTSEAVPELQEPAANSPVGS
ncbi:MAG: NADH-quinone oxidoreductase subunit J, partial [Chloroflexota bacterium]